MTAVRPSRPHCPTRAPLLVIVVYAVAPGCYFAGGLGSNGRELSLQASAGLTVSLGKSGHRALVRGGAAAALVGEPNTDNAATKTSGHFAIGATLPLSPGRERSWTLDADATLPVGGSYRNNDQGVTVEANIGRYYLGVGQRLQAGSPDIFGGFALGWSVGPELFTGSDAAATDQFSVLGAAKLYMVMSPILVGRVIGEILDDPKH